MKRKSLIITMTSILFFLSSLIIIGITLGWYADVFDLNSGTVSVGDIRYTQAGDFITDGQVIYPGMELVDTSLTLTNESPIDSQMRVKISYTKVTRPVDVLVVETVDYAGAVDDHISVTFDSTFVYDTGYWYYGSTSQTILADSGLINLISSIYYDGDLVGNDYAGITCNITITVEVKQNDNVTWAELTSYDFSTGYPA